MKIQYPEDFDLSARQTLSFAYQEAQRTSHNYVGTEHLLLAMIMLDQMPACQILQKLGIETDVLLQETLIQMKRSSTTGELKRKFDITPRLKKVFSLALRMPGKMQDTQTTNGHLLYGLLHEGEGVAAAALNIFEIQKIKVQQELVKLQAGC